MTKVVFCTFTRRHGRQPGLIRHGFINLDDFRSITVIPDTVIYVDIYQRSLVLYHSNKTSEEIELDYWGFSGNLFSMCKDMKDLQFPFECHCVVNSVFGEFE